MNLFIYTGASRLNAAVVESATDLTAVSRLPDLIVGDSEPVTVKFLSASGAYESWSGGGTYTLSISIGALGGDGIAAYFQTSSFTAVTNGWTGRLNLASGSLPSVVAGYLAERPGAQSVPLFVQVRVTDADGNTETYARQAVSVSGAVSVPTTANSTPVTYATAADVAADAATASAAAIAAAASASAASGSASTAAGHVTTAGNSATAAAASAVTAGNSATTASGHATTATTQATNASTSASTASTHKDAAAVSAASATSSAGTATTQAAAASASATAAGISAAAALVSEAAALVSKNAAAASAATASAVSGSGNGTFSAAALTGVNSITASASTALTLTGGSTGASLVLGHTAGASMSSASKLNLSNTTSASSSTVGALTIGNGTALTNVAIGSGIIHAGRDIRSGASGTLQGVVTVYSGDTASAEGNIAGRSGGGLLLNTNGNNYPIALNGSAVSLAPSPTASASVSVPGTLSASSSIAGAFLVGNGTAATNVAVGAGKVNIGSTEGSTGVGTGSLQTAGGAYIGGNTIFGIGIGVFGAQPSAGMIGVTIGALSGTNQYGITDQNGSYTVIAPATEVMGHRVYSTLALGASNTLTNWYGFNSTLSSKTGAAALTNAYAFYANSPTQAANNYAFYSAGTAPSVFGGAVTATNLTANGNAATSTASTAILDYSTGARVIARGTGVANYGVVKIAGTDSAGSTAITGGIVATFDSSNGAATFAGAVTLSAGTATATNAAATQGIFKGWNSRSGANADNGQIDVGGATGLRLMSDASGTGGSVVDDRWDNAASSLAFRLRGNGTPVTSLTLTSASATFAAVVIKKNYTVATLPAAASYTYGEAYVSDATQAAGTSLGSAPTGGGSVKRGVYSDGSAWLLR